MKVPQLFEEAVVKYQRIVWLAVGPHAIHVQARGDLNRKWLPTPYKLSDAELKAMVNDWPIEWREPVSLEEVSMGCPANAPVDPMHKDDQQSDQDSDQELMETPTDPEAKRMLNKLRTKRCMEQGASSSTAQGMEAQLNRLIKAVADATHVAGKEMMKCVQVGFNKVRTKLDSLYDLVLKRALESMNVKDFASINTEPQVRNVQTPLTAIVL